MERCRENCQQNLQHSRCSGPFSALHGRPCLHDLISIIESNGGRYLEPEDFDKFWWIYRDQGHFNPLRIQDPATITQTRHSGSKRRRQQQNYGAGGTDREPTLSERIDSNHPATPPNSAASYPSDPQFVFGTQVDDEVLPFQALFFPSRSWGYTGQLPFSNTRSDAWIAGMYKFYYIYLSLKKHGVIVVCFLLKSRVRIAPLRSTCNGNVGCNVNAIVMETLNVTETLRQSLSVLMLKLTTKPS
ncbi:unnamed protein product [Phytophthora fragariaefolia]|uniref:Unnamed protein product n=1 Tax=Phytophthora fragariaefolia TaxID=1490495 RepID=A0A9W6TRL8_9STRA|nr:unnamed protein product [Phytophthora fragariaefolia]